MKQWLGVIGFALTFFGIGFAVGQDYERKIAKKIRNAPELCPERVEENVTPESEGYAENENDICRNYETADNVMDGKTAYKNGDKITGEVETYLAEHESPEEEEKEVPAREKGEMPEETISFITAREFYEEQVYDRVELFFYEDNLTVCDEFDKPIDHPEELVGTEVMDILCANEGDVLFARNDWNECVYKISRVKGGFEAEDVDKSYPI